MTGNDLLQLAVFLGVLLLLVKPLGLYFARVFDGAWSSAPERWIYRLAGVNARAPTTWTAYAGALLIFNFAGLVAVYTLLRLQHLLPWNPQGFAGLEPHTAFNIAVSFATNTDWQNYGGETTLSYFTQMAGLTVQNFVSAASGMAVLAALARGVVSRSAKDIGNFWVDMVRGTLYVLAPLSVALAGGEVHLTPIEFRLLQTLVRHAGKVITQRQLLVEVWGPQHGEQAQYLRVYMSQRRRKLEADPARPRFLLTELGVGYRLLEG